MTQAYDPAAQAALDELERQILAQAQGGNVPPSIYREADIPNPYYNMPGSREAYEQYGIPPVLVQNQPYATAAYMTQPNGSVSPLIGYPSVYPHVLNGVPQDYAAPYIMGGGNFAAGGNYGYDPNTAVQQAQSLLMSMMQGGPRQSAAPMQQSQQPAAPAAGAPGGSVTLPPVDPLAPPPPSGGGTTPPMSPAVAPVTTNNLLAAAHVPVVAGIDPGMAAAHVPYTAAQETPSFTSAYGGPSVVAPQILPELMNSRQVQPSVAEGIPPLIPTPTTLAEAAKPATAQTVAAQTAGALSPSQQYQWQRFLDTGLWSSTFYNTPADFAAAHGLVIPENRIPQAGSAYNPERDANRSAPSAPPTPVELPTIVQQAQTPTAQVVSDMQAATQVLNDPNSSWFEQLWAYSQLLQGMQMFGKQQVAQSIGEGVSQFGHDLARAARQGPNPNSVAPMLMPKPVPMMTPMGPVMVPMP